MAAVTPVCENNNPTRQGCFATIHSLANSIDPRGFVISGDHDGVQAAILEGGGFAWPEWFHCGALPVAEAKRSIIASKAPGDLAFDFAKK
jgi:hypothetical protein